MKWTENNYTKKSKNNIINIAIGKFGKTKNNKNISKIYFNKAEAYKYSKDYNGEVFTISSSNFYDTPCNEEELKNNIAAKLERKKVYLLSIQRNKKLKETLLPIQHFIYSNQRLKVYYCTGS